VPTRAGHRLEEQRQTLEAAPGSADVPALASPFHHHLEWLADPAERQERLSAALPLRRILPLSSGEPSRQWLASLPLGGLLLTALIATSTRLLLDRQSGITVLLGYGGELRLRQAHQVGHCRPNSLLLLGGEPCLWEGQAWSVVALKVPTESLLAACQAMAGEEAKPSAWKRLIHSTHSFQLGSDDGTVPLQEALRHLVAMIADLTNLGEPGKSLLQRVQLEDPALRLLAALLVPELRRAQPLELARQRLARDPFAELLSYIQQHLADPLNLSELETHSHYSRRALQYAFQERLGCTASQWIRGQRLDLARRSLEHPQPADTVGSIATACGYRSMSLFSIDFQQRFHVKPSQVLREARASHPG
jgi:AraC-like DNA-binding protein